MARFYDVVGYGESRLSSTGVASKEILEHSYYGDVIKNTRDLDNGSEVNPSISARNRISILADQYAIEHFHAILYVRWAGTLWVVTSVDVQSPRLILSLGGVYNGPTPTTP